MFKINNMAGIDHDQDSTFFNVRGMRDATFSLSTRCAKRVNSSLLSYSFKNKFLKTYALKRYQNNRGSGIFKTAAIRAPEREKVTHHRTDYQVTSRSTRSKDVVVCTGRKGKIWALIVSLSLSLSLESVRTFCVNLRRRPSRSDDDVSTMMFAVLIFFFLSSRVLFLS